MPATTAAKSLPSRVATETWLVVMGNTTLLTLPANGRFGVETGEEKSNYYVFGLTPEMPYDVEVDDEEMYEARPDKGGVLELAFGAKRKAGVIVRRSPKEASRLQG